MQPCVMCEPGRSSFTNILVRNTTHVNFIPTPHMLSKMNQSMYRKKTKVDIMTNQEDDDETEI